MWCDLDAGDLHAFIDGELGESRSREVGSHVSSCPQCHAELQRLRAADDLVRREDSKLDLSAMRAQLLLQVGPPRRQVTLRRVLPAAAIVAAFCIGTRLLFPARDSGPPEPVPAPAHVAASFESLELDAASLRLSLVAENPSREVREHLDSRLDAIVGRIQKLRSMNPSGN